MNPAAVRATLLAQHGQLRELFDQAQTLARRREADPEDAAGLDELLAEIGRVFEAHNRYEEAILRPMLLALDGLGAARVDRMLEEHAGEHRAFAEHLATEAARSAAALSDFVEEVEAHMAAEERVFLNVAVLRDPG